MDDTQRIIGQLLAEVAASREETRALRAEVRDLRSEVTAMRNDWSEVKGGKKVALGMFSILGAIAGVVTSWLSGIIGKGAP